MTNWNELWKNRKAVSDRLNYEDLLKLNGYDGAQSDLNTRNLPAVQEIYAKKMDLQREDDIYEIACGAGAFLYNWSAMGHPVGGCDISEGLLACAKRALPYGIWHLDSAETFQVARRWDHIVSFGLCMYISPQKLEALIGRMVMKAHHTVSVFDIPDLAKREACEEHRRSLIPDYDNKYKGLEHFYHSKEEVAGYFNALGFNCDIYDQDIPGYENAKWRFNVTVSL